MKFDGLDASDARAFAERWLPARLRDGRIRRNEVYLDRPELLRAVEAVQRPR